MSDQRPMERVLSALRREIREGERLPGEGLPLAALSARFRVSPTPVREALAHLAGEGLVEDSRGRGYACRPLDERGYRELLDLQDVLLGAAALWRERRAEEGDVASRLQGRLAQDAQAVRATAWLMDRLAESARHEALGEAVSRINGRLGAPRRAEARVLEAVGEELVDLAEAADSFDRQRLQARLYGYHERRRLRAGEICDVLREHSRLRRDGRPEPDLT